MRYTRLPLPSYAFLPGTDPHPTADPRGHSYGRKPPAAPRQPAGQWANCTPYLYGCDLFNQAYFWEAHEAWEALWMSCERNGIQALYLQGLIQAANTLLKQRMQRPRAVARLRREVLHRLSTIPDPYMGLGIRRWTSAFDQYLTHTGHCDFPLLELKNYI